MTRDRVLRAYPHWLLAAACAGLASSNVTRASSLAGVVAVGCALGAVVAASAEVRLVLLGLALAAVGWWWGSARLADLDASTLARHAGRAAPALVTVTGPVRKGTFRLRAPAEVGRFGDLRLGERVLLELPLGRAPPQGAVMELVGEVRLPRAASDGFDERTWLRHQGIQVVLRASRWRIVGRRGGLAGLADGIRAHLTRTLSVGADGERRAVLAGVVLGADEGLPEELRDRFRASGLYHLLAVSGQNVVLIAAAVLGFAWLLGVPRWLGELAVLAAIGSYVMAVGLQASVVRAGVAGALASLAWLAARPRDRWYFLLVGAAILLAWNPYNILEPGFQLSFAAVAAIFVGVPRLERALEGYPVPRPLAAVLAVSAVCAVATAPILWVHFGAVPLLSLVSNALAGPAVAPLLVSALAAGVIEPFVPGAAAALAWCAQWAAAYVAACARLVGGLPHAQVSSLTGLFGVAAAPLAAAVLVRLRPPRVRRAAVLVATAAVALVGWHLRPEAKPPPGPAGVRLTFLDVGQGDSVLLQVPEGAVLVDEGPPEADVAGQLRELGVRRLAAMVLTHPQRDHVGGAADVLARLPVGFVLDPRLEVGSPDQAAALAEAREQGVRVVTARSGDSYRLGRLRLRVLWPPDEGLPGEDPNQNAVVLLASYGKADALLAADAETDVTGRLRLPRVEILKVAHHGSADPGLPALLKTLRPAVAVISVGVGNDYGHPAPSTLAALARFPGLAVYRTDRDGRVSVESDGARVWVRDER